MISDNDAGAILIPKPNFADVLGRTLSPQGQQIVPALGGLADGTVPGSPLASGWVIMRPSWVSNRHRHDHTWVKILVWAGSAITRWWGPNGEEHEIRHGVGEIVVVRPGVEHAGENASDTQWVIAYETRSSNDISVDNVPLEGASKAGIDLHEVPVHELNTLLDRPTPPRRTSPTGQMQIQPLQSYPIQPFEDHRDGDTARWSH